jgi:hypothetical protein
MNLKDRGKKEENCVYELHYFVPLISYYSSHDTKECYIGATCRLYWKNVKHIVLL